MRPRKMKLNIELLKDVTSPVPRTSQIGCFDFVATVATKLRHPRGFEPTRTIQRGSNMEAENDHLKLRRVAAQPPQITKRVHLRKKNKPACQLKGRVKKRPAKI